jgi:hypothetical protein
MLIVYMLCHYECRYAECHLSKCRLKCRYAECHLSKCRLLSLC